VVFTCPSSMDRKAGQEGFAYGKSNWRYAVKTKGNHRRFQLSEGREKLELLLQFAEQMPALPDWLQQDRSQMEFVQNA